MNIRQAQEKDVSRIAEILVYNNRVNLFFWEASGHVRSR